MSAPLPEDRARQFTPGWFRDLFAARLSFGETFWMGHMGLALVSGPFIGAGIMLTSPAARAGTVAVVLLLAALVQSAVTQAVIRRGMQVQGLGGWRWVGMAASVVISAALIWATARAFT